MNRSKKVSLCGIILFLAALLAGTPGWAEKGEGEGKMGGKMMKKLEEKLNLTPDQKDKMKANRKEHRERMKGLQEKMSAIQSELKEELDKASADEKKIGRIASEIKELHSQMVDERVKGILAMKQVLTPEQYTKLIEMRNEKKEKKGRDKKKGKGWGEHKGEGGPGDLP